MSKRFLVTSLTFAVPHPPRDRTTTSQISRIHSAQELQKVVAGYHSEPDL